jgi:hypothetical protein
MNNKINKDDELTYKNSEGYSDPTAYEAIKKADYDFELARRSKLLKAIYAICDLAGYHVAGRIVLRDKFTGKVWE